MIPAALGLYGLITFVQTIEWVELISSFQMMERILLVRCDVRPAWLTCERNRIPHADLLFFRKTCKIADTMSKKLIQDFKEFAFKGNVLDLAVGVIIGGAFGKIVSSLVNDIVMPPFGFILKGIDFKSFAWVLQRGADGAATVSVLYGNFLQNFIEFLIIGFSVFMLVRAIRQVEKRFRKEEQAVSVSVPPSEDIVLLREIRDLLKRG